MLIKHQQHGLLPTYTYTSQEWFDWEMVNLWGKNWHLAGFISDLPDKGDYKTVQVGAHPIFVMRGDDGNLRAFHNLCRHRGTQLLRAAGKAKQTIVCPYHNWRYSQEGELTNIPQQQQQFAGVEIDKSRLCLHKAAVSTWREMIWVHPDPNAAPLMEWLADVPQHVGPHQPDKLVEYNDTVLNYDIKANWKIFFENAIDVYHLAHLHSQTLNMYDHRQLKQQTTGLHQVAFEPLAKWYREDLSKFAPYKLIDHIPDDKLGAHLQYIFPGFIITETESTWSVLRMTPVAPDRTLVEVRSRLMPMSTTDYLTQGWRSWSAWDSRAKKVDEKDVDHDDPLQSGDFMAEDIYACEQQQKAMRSPLFSSGPAAAGEASVEAFHRAVLQFCPLDG